MAIASRGRSECVAHTQRSGPARSQLEAVKLAIYRDLDKTEDLQVVPHTHGEPRAEISHRTAAALDVRQRTLVMALARYIDLHLRHDLGIGLVAQAKAHGGEVARAKVIAWLGMLECNRGLETPMDT